MFAPSLSQVEMGARGPGTGDRLLRWRRAVAAMAPPAALLAVAWTALGVPYAINGGARGWSVVLIAIASPAITLPLLGALVALVDAVEIQRRYRSLAISGLALLAAALSSCIEVSLLVAVKLWPAPPWSTPVIWWANMGVTATFCVGAALVYDYRLRSKARAAALRAARAQSAAVARRTVDTRLQAARARVDPRFLFDALGAVERIHEIDAAAGDRLLDDLVAYLRAVLPDLQEPHSTLRNELALARLWLDIRRQFSPVPMIYAVDAMDDCRDIRFPPMTLVPLLEACLPSLSHTATVAVRARQEGAQTAIHIECDAPTATGSFDGAMVAEVRARLRELHGDQVRLALSVEEPGRRVAAVEGNFAHADGDPR